MSNNIGYHTRLYNDVGTKVCGGSFGGSIDMETVNRLMRLFTVVVKPSGTPVFVDREGREVRLYITVDARETELGKKALAEWRKTKVQEEEERQEREEREAEEINALMRSLSHDEIISRLRKGA